MKKIMLVAMAAVSLLLTSPLARGADYSRMSTADLAAMRSTMQNATVEERRAFQQEWQRRVRLMTPDERRQYLGPPAKTPAVKTPPGYGPEAEEGQPAVRRRQRNRLIAPPASVAPRRFGERTREEPRQQVGPRRFAPTPDFNGGSPFNLNSNTGESGDVGTRRR